MITNKKKQKVYEIGRKFAATKKPFLSADVWAELGNDFTEEYVAYKLYDLSTGSFPILRRLTPSTFRLVDTRYISIKVKPPKKKKVKPGVDKETFHNLYGCFGVGEVVKGGRYLYNKQTANYFRLELENFIRRYNPNRAGLTSHIKYLVEKENAYKTKQSIQIGIIQALQNNEYAGQDIYGILNDIFGGIWKGRTNQDAILRENAAKLRAKPY